ncbi:MAG: hypothetical protein ACFNYJ_04845 [Segatella oris]
MDKKIEISMSYGKVQHLSEVLPLIPTNTILCKTLMGIGATYGELRAARNSIIIEPNRPVIYGKCRDPKHTNDNLFGVYEGIYTQDVVNYIIKSQDRNKKIKILTTPESFYKVRMAFEQVGIDIRTDGYFLLFDECQKIVKDCGYRKNISLPMDYFFECNDKAMVSATPPSEFADPRFKDFDIITICPNFNYKKAITVCVTNNVLERTRLLLTELNEQPVFFFVNSTDIILAMIEQLRLKEESAVFCSADSVDKLKSQKFCNAHENWNQNHMAKYNWMTSRFYNALDIELEYKPNVVMITDCFTADYTMIDPYMDAMQIMGRFRNGTSNIYHISNLDGRILVRGKSDIVTRYQCDKEIYEHIETLKNMQTDFNCRDAFSEALEVLPYNRFLDDYGKEDAFKIDNYIHEEQIKVMYHDSTRLYRGYEECGYYDVATSNTTYKYGDFERLKIRNATIPIKEKQKQLVKQLEALKGDETEMAMQFRNALHNADPLIVEAWEVLGKEIIEELNYNPKSIREKMILTLHKKKAKSSDVIRMVNNSFKPRHWYSSRFIKQELRRIHELLGVPKNKAITAKAILQYFEATERRTNEARGYYLVSPKFITE